MRGERMNFGNRGVGASLGLVLLACSSGDGSGVTSGTAFLTAGDAPLAQSDEVEACESLPESAAVELLDECSTLPEQDCYAPSPNMTSQEVLNQTLTLIAVNCGMPANAVRTSVSAQFAEGCVTHVQMSVPGTDLATVATARQVVECVESRLKGVRLRCAVGRPCGVGRGASAPATQAPLPNLPSQVR